MEMSEKTLGMIGVIIVIGIVLLVIISVLVGGNPGEWMKSITVIFQGLVIYMLSSIGAILR